MKHKKVYTTIQENSSRFTAVEKLIADYFLKNKEHDDFSIHAMRDKLYVSKSSLSRFAQKCGYKGYREFIYRYEEELLADTNDISEETKLVLHTYDHVFKQTMDLIDDEQLQRVVQCVSNANHIIVMGVSSSGLAAKEMKNRFMRHHIMMEAIVQMDDMILQSSLLDKDALCIAISISGTKPSVIKSLKQASNVGANTILITGNSVDDFTYCNEVIRVPMLAYEHTITTQFPILIIIDLIYQLFISNR